MRYLHIDHIEPGQFLGKTIFSSNGQVMLAEGVQLTVYMISTLRRIGVTTIYIKDVNFEDVEIEEVVSEATKQKVIKQMANSFETIRSGKEFSSRNIGKSIDLLLEEVLQNKDVLLQLTDIRTEDNQAYVHALNVCTMAMLIGMNLDLNYAQLKELSIGALFHDIGKIGLHGEEDSKSNHHTWRGFELLKAKREYSLLIAHVAFQHHEAVDGSGLPRGLESDQIHLYAKIIAVVNTFDNLLSDFSHEQRILPHEASEKIMSMVGTVLDHHVTVHFLKTVSIYPTGISVRLSNRETGVVVGQHRGLPSRPIVRMVSEDKGEGNWHGKEIDLAQNPTLFIEKVLN